MGSVKSLPTMLQKSVPTMFQKCCNQGVERASRVLLRYLAVILTAVTDGALAFDNPAPSAPSVQEQPAYHRQKLAIR